MGKEKKEIGKLLELLNEYEKDGVNEFETYVERWYCERTYQILSGKWENSNELKPCEIISKRYGFIKWLVDNDKIDTDAYKTVYSGDLDKRKTLTMSSGGDEFYQVTEHGIYESLLMLLSISDTPIEDLLLYLK